MEELNKNQLILLALLVSFVTSIATGIVTVSLMQQAPQSVTQTINKVITQTIERVTKEPATVIWVTEDDLITAAVDKNQNGSVKIQLGEDGEVVGNGTVISEGGLIVSDVNPADYALEVKYYAIFPDNKKFPLALFTADKSGFSLFKSDFGGNSKNPYKPVFLRLGDSDKLKLGQTVLVISPGDDTLQKGIISGLVKDSTTEGTATSTGTSGIESDTPIKSVKLLKLSISLSRENSSSPLINLDGDVVGITIYREGVRGAIPSNIIKESLAALNN